MHTEILTQEQIDLLPLVKSFFKDFYLVGGTAIALQIGHRRSIDFDLFSEKEFINGSIKSKIRRSHEITKILYESSDELTLTIEGVKMTFYHYPFKIPTEIVFDKTMNMPNLLTLASMKAFALGQRAKWKDYVDLYFLFQRYKLEEIANKARDLFKGEFNEKLFREQIGYFADVNYEEKIEYMPKFEIEDKKVKGVLASVSLEQ